MADASIRDESVKRKPHSAGTSQRPIDRPAKCAECGEIKSPDKYYQHKRKYWLSLGARCKPCESEYRKRNNNRIKSDPNRYAEHQRVRAQYRVTAKDRIDSYQSQYNDARRARDKLIFRCAAGTRQARLSKKFIRDSQEALEAGRLGKLEAWKDWLSIATESWLNNYYTDVKKPWHDHRLTRSEKTQIKRKHCPEMAIYDRLRSAASKQAKDGNVAESMRRAIKGGGTSNKVESLCGYSIERLKSHIESRFTNDMSWQRFNLGEIHIDHIIPKSVFDCSITEELIDCWSLDNLQPLWAKDNLSKKQKAVAELCCPILWMKYGSRVKVVESRAEASWAA